MTRAFIFPGQGSQAVGMGLALLGAGSVAAHLSAATIAGGLGLLVGLAAALLASIVS